MPVSFLSPPGNCLLRSSSELPVRFWSQLGFGICGDPSDTLIVYMKNSQGGLPSSELFYPPRCFGVSESPYRLGREVQPNIDCKFKKKLKKKKVSKTNKWQIKAGRHCWEARPDLPGLLEGIR